MSEIESSLAGVKTPSDMKFKTYGCKVNTYDTGLLEKRIQANFTYEQTRQIHVLNTCAVTREATLEAVREARRIKRKNSDAVVVVTGCAAQVDTDEFKDLLEADLVIANSHKGQLEDILTGYLKGESTERVHKSNIFKKEDLEAGGGIESHHTRSFLKIQDGCNSFCTFCVIPFARGKSRSLTIQDLRKRVNEFYDQGLREVVLTGVHIGDYEEGLEALVEDLLLNTKMPRLRLASLEPIEVTSRLLDCFQDARVCSHFHMSIQSANTSVLAGMKRKYTSGEVEFALNEIARRVPGAYVGMDVIAGFVGESDADFEDTYLRLANLPWTRIHVFPYSERPGTFALKLDGKVDSRTLHRRALQLRELSWNRVLAEAKKQIGQTKKVLILKNQLEQNLNNAQATQKVGRHLLPRHLLPLLPGVARDQWSVDVLAEGVGGLNLSEEVQVRMTGYRERPARQDVVLVGEVIF